MAAQHSPFLQPGQKSEADQLAFLHLRRDLSSAAILRAADTEDEGYSEGKVTNTRFGSFPHTTLIGIPWGSQVRASLVDTGSRGRRAPGSSGPAKKRKREPEAKDAVKNSDTAQILSQKQEPNEISDSPVTATSGFIHLLPPTPESWTASLPHRTHVVYTPDYSYVLHRLRARPGCQIIEAGAGSGSFTHAAARAVAGQDAASRVSTGRPRPAGRVWSFEFHEQRVEKLKEEIFEHGLDDVVSITHRDVYEEGFVLDDDFPGVNVKANAVFLDLPAPWLALRHLGRQEGSSLDPATATHLCTFSPCLEQVQRTVTTLRQLGWVEIEVTELSAKRIDVRRERAGLQEEGLRGCHDTAANVEEALSRLAEVERRSRALHNSVNDGEGEKPILQSKQARLQSIKDAQIGRKLYKEGQLLTRAEPDLKTHTSYLVFAILPCSWTHEDEETAIARLANLNASKGMNESQPAADAEMAGSAVLP